MTKDAKILRDAIITGNNIHTPEVAAAYDREAAAWRKEQAIRRLRRAGHLPPARRIRSRV